MKTGHAWYAVSPSAKQERNGFNAQIASAGHICCALQWRRAVWATSVTTVTVTMTSEVSGAVLDPSIGSSVLNVESLLSYRHR